MTTNGTYKSDGISLPSFPEITTLKWSCNDEAKRFAVENPATGETLTTIQAGDERTTKEAIAASKVAFDTIWKYKSPRERSVYLMQCAALLEKHQDEIATILSLENGKPKQDAFTMDTLFLVNIFRYFASLVDKLPSEFYDRGPMYCTVMYEPHGVCAGILPFNWPPLHTGGKLAPALAAGNTMILKPGEQAPLSVIRIVELLQTVLPENVVQVVPGLGPEVPQALITSPTVKMVSFTGSTAAGKAVAKAAAESLTPTVQELGGKNAFVVFDDATLSRAVRDALEGAFFNKGEACTATSRILVQEKLYHEFCAELAKAVPKLKTGYGIDPATHVGPCVSRAQRDKVQSYIDLGRKEADAGRATLAAQADLPSDPRCKEGFFVRPTLFTDVDARTSILARDEMFGPVVTVSKFETLEDAMEIVNASEYGLTAAVYTENMTRANRAVREIDTGLVYVNNYFRAMLGTPFGGVKQTGYGREHCIETLREWSRAKAVHTVSGRGEVPAWRALKDIF